MSQTWTPRLVQQDHSAWVDSRMETHRGQACLVVIAPHSAPVDRSELAFMRHALG